MLISFSVRGSPGTKGSVRAFVRGGKAQIVNDSAKARPWTALVQDAATQAMRAAQPLQGPVRVLLVYVLPRPKGHFLPQNAKRPLPVLRSGAAEMPDVKPDLDKLARCALDALTGICFGDDAQIVDLRVVKQYGGALGLTAVTHFTVEPYQSSRATCDAHATPPGGA